MKNILITNSRAEKNQFLVDLLEGLKGKDYNFFLLSSKSELIEQFNQNKWNSKKILLGPDLCSKINIFYFVLLLPLFWFFYFFVLAFYKFRKKTNILICLNWNEKIVFSFLAKVFKIKIIWLEFPDTDYRKCPKILLRLFKFSSRKVKLVTFNSQKKYQLQSMKLTADSIEIFLPGVKYKKAVHQDNIFHNIAQVEKSNFNKKYFTLGTVTDFEHPNQLETLFQAAKICLDVIPNLQIIIVGEGIDRKQVTWNAKKMGVENLVWFVGRQDHLRKWLDSFDVYVSVCETPKLMDLKLTLRAMLAKLPIIGYSDRGQEDLIREGNTGLLTEAGSSEDLAEKIIKLQQNRLLLNRIGENAKAMVEEQFNIDGKVEEFERVISD